MSRRTFRQPQAGSDIFGRWVGITALLASKTEALAAGERVRIMARLHVALEEIAKGSNPSVLSWRDLTDAMNFLQSATELGWATDEEGAVSAAKAGLLTGYENVKKHGVVRMDGPGLAGMRNLLEQLQQVLDQISAHSYWQLVAHTQKRVLKVARGAARKGDTVVQL